jgi:hypothetical protein
MVTGYANTQGCSKTKEQEQVLERMGGWGKYWTNLAMLAQGLDSETPSPKPAGNVTVRRKVWCGRTR